MRFINGRSKVKKSNSNSVILKAIVNELIHLSNFVRCLGTLKSATSKIWTYTQDSDPAKPGHRKTWTLKNVDPQVHES